MRQSEVKGKLCRFLAGMRAYERQQAAAAAAAPPRPLPPVLSEFIAWAGEFLLTDGGGGGGARNQPIEARARTFLQRKSQDAAPASSFGDEFGGSGGGDLTANNNSNSDYDDWCCICLEKLSDAAVFDELGEPVETVDCGHRFHAVCFARHLEASEQDPWCPMCRGGDLAVRFV